MRQIAMMSGKQDADFNSYKCPKIVAEVPRNKLHMDGGVDAQDNLKSFVAGVAFVTQNRFPFR